MGVPCQRTERGFTLVEIMIVVACIGLLASLAMPAMAKARTQSINQKCILNMRAIHDAVIRYEMEHNSTMFSIRNNGVQIRNTLLASGYMNPQNNFDCPSSPIKDFDDYTLQYLNGTDFNKVLCSIVPTTHIQP